MHTLRIIALSSALLCAGCAPSTSGTDSGARADVPLANGSSFAFMVSLEWRSASTVSFSWVSSNGVALLYDVSSDPSAPCSAAARTGRNGVFALPTQADMSPNGAHTLLITSSAPSIGNYHGPGTYTMPDVSLTGTVDDEAFDSSGQSTTVTVNPDGSGTATTTGISSTTNSALTMTMTWTCVNR